MSCCWILSFCFKICVLQYRNNCEAPTPRLNKEKLSRCNIQFKISCICCEITLTMSLTDSHIDNFSASFHEDIFCFLSWITFAIRLETRSANVIGPTQRDLANSEAALVKPP